MHHGHLNILKTARKLGDVTIGLLTDEAIASYKDYLTYPMRREPWSKISRVHKVIPQSTLDYV